MTFIYLGRVAARIVAAIRPHPCRNGHTWRQIGGRNCGCGADGACSVPVYECVRCPACDYGDNEEADRIRADCRERSRSDFGL
jgi:hypothetical protein